MNTITIPEPAFTNMRRIIRQHIGRTNHPVFFSAGCSNADALSWPITYFCRWQGKDYIHIAHQDRLSQIRAYPGLK